MSRTTRRPRGQNLVLLALTMLFVTLMVTMTIGLGVRVRQKHELQTLADTSAYSNAVMTARTFNNMAVINRLEVAYWVALAADQSLISWTSYARAMANATANASGTLARSSCVSNLPLVTRQQVNGFKGDVRQYVLAELEGKADAWHDQDTLAGLEAKEIQGRVGSLRDEITDGMIFQSERNLRDRFFEAIEGQSLTSKLIWQAGLRGQVEIIDAPTRGRTPNSAAAVTRREVDCEYPNSKSGLCFDEPVSEGMLMAAMGTRHNTFVTGRGQVPDKIAARLNAIKANYDRVSLLLGPPVGAGYWAGTGDSDQRWHGKQPTRTESWADDDGLVSVSAGGCTEVLPVTSWLRSTHIDDDQDKHRWAPKLQGENGEDSIDPDPPEYHTMARCKPYCPSVWVRTVGFKPGDTAGDAAPNAWGEPKVMVALERLPTPRPLPWELHFDFPFSAAGDAAKWDARGERIVSGSGKGLQLQQGAAVSTGMAYYHRRKHWDEAPNLLNPFWRATLVPMNVDETGPFHGARRDDLDAALSPQRFEYQRAAYRALRGAGFEGIH